MVVWAIKRALIGNIVANSTSISGILGIVANNYIIIDFYKQHWIARDFKQHCALMQIALDC